LKRLLAGVIGAGLVLSVAYAAYSRVAFGTFWPFGVPERVQYGDRRYYPSWTDSVSPAADSLRTQQLTAGELVTTVKGMPPATEILVAPKDVRWDAPAVIYVKALDGSLYPFGLSGGL